VRHVGLVFLALVLVLRPSTVGAAAVPARSGAAPVFTFADGVSAEDRAYVTEGFRLAQDFDRTAFDAEFREPVVFDVGPKPGAATRGAAYDHTVTFATDHPVWTGSSPLWRVKAPVHESFHVLEYEWTKGRDWGPIWLIEGSAELVAWTAVSAKGLVADGLMHDRWIQGTQNGAVSGVPLDQMESPNMPQDVRCCLYGVAPLAVEQLVAGPGLRSLRTYFEAIGDGASWQAAFERAFGQTPESFYTTFETVRWQLVPAGYDLTPVRFPFDVGDGAAEAAVVSVSSPIKRGEQAMVIAATAPGIPCTLDFVSVSGKHLLTQPTHAGPDGTVFWLWSLRPRLARGTATATIGCGGTPATVGVEIR
jgi:hypothetical protein